MKVGIISDIHSNLFYLKEILKKLQEHSLDSIYCLGDMVGYYDQPNEVIELLRENGIFCIKGNHDKYFLEELSFDKDRDVLYRMIIQRSEVSDENKDFLRSLPDFYDVNISNKRVYMTHSLPSDSETYLNNVNELDREFIKDFDYYLYGHTHRCHVQYHFGTCVINPGSVGQPRDYNILPSYAVIDFDKESVLTERVKVNTGSYLAQLKGLDFDQRVIATLERNKFES